MVNVLQAIVAHKKEMLANIPDYSNLELSQRSFADALNKKEFGFIMECKMASPSKGLIRESFNIEEITPIYDKYADAISVLTEERFFRGSFSNLKLVSETTDKPVLCKDFILQPKQVRQARFFGADAILLMLSVLNDEDYLKCYEQAELLGMDVLTEVHDEIELGRALVLGSKIIGVNNRDLKNLTTDLNNTKRLARLIPQDRIIVTESGIYSHQDVMDLSPFADACLVGSSLMEKHNLEKAACQLVYGDIKICGITSQKDAELVADFPSSYLGIIFAENSKRKYFSEDPIVSDKPLVGVFQDQSVEYVLDKAKRFKLRGIQLHGSESKDYIAQLKKGLVQSFDENTFISKVVHVTDTIDFSSAIKVNDISEVNEILFDTQIGKEQGGTGQTFNWKLLDDLPSLINGKVLRVAGGLCAGNIRELKNLGFNNLDICGGSEENVGNKSLNKLIQIFENAKVMGRTHQEE